MDAAPNAAALKRDHLLERWAQVGLTFPALGLVFICMILPVGWLFWLSFLADDGTLSLIH